MAVNIKSGIDANYLQTKLFKEVLVNFEPNLYFYKMGEKPMVDNGIGTVSWTKASKLSVTALFHPSSLSFSPVQSTNLSLSFT